MNARKCVHAQKPYPSQAFAHESSKVGGRGKIKEERYYATTDCKVAKVKCLYCNTLVNYQKLFWKPVEAFWGNVVKIAKNTSDFKHEKLRFCNRSKKIVFFFYCFLPPFLYTHVKKTGVFFFAAHH